MLESVYLLFSAIGLISIVISLGIPSIPIMDEKRSKKINLNPLLMLFSFIVCSFLAISSGDIVSLHCETAENDTGCFTHTSYEANLVYFWGGLGLVMLILAIAGLLNVGFANMEQVIPGFGS